jgi:hypothetical protein
MQFLVCVVLWDQFACFSRFAFIGSPSIVYDDSSHRVQANAVRQPHH